MSWFINFVDMKIIRLLFVWIIFSGINGYARQIEPNLREAFNQQIIEIKSMDSSDTSEFNALIKDMAGFKIIGLGEATHGTKEFYQYKSKLIRYLIEHQRLRMLIFESDMVGMESINDYVFN